MIRKRGSKFRVESHTGRNLGEFSTKEEAKNRLGQVEYFKHKRGKRNGR